MEFSDKCQQWLDTKPQDRNLEAGATLMLQANRNRILHTNVLNRRNFEKIEYELRKYLSNNYPNRKKEDKVDITHLEHKLSKSVDLFTEEKKGQRADHNQLPSHIQSLYELNREQYHVLRSVHEKLKVLSGSKYNPDERKPLIEQLFSINDKIRKNWETYDKFDMNTFDANLLKKNEETRTIDFKEMNANKVYLSRCSAQIEAKKQKGKQAEAEAIVLEARKRYEELVKAGNEFKPELIEKLKKAGVIE